MGNTSFRGTQGALNALKSRLTERMCAHLLNTCPRPSQQDLDTLAAGQEYYGDIFSEKAINEVNQALLPYYVMKQLLYDEGNEIDYRSASWIEFDRIYGEALFKRVYK